MALPFGVFGEQSEEAANSRPLKDISEMTVIRQGGSNLIPPRGETPSQRSRIARYCAVCRSLALRDPSSCRRRAMGLSEDFSCKSECGIDPASDREYCSRTGIRTISIVESIAMLDLDSLLRNGFFPKELPPTFQTASFADYVGQQGGLAFKGGNAPISRPAVHNLGRSGQVRRNLKICNPFNQYELAEILVIGADEIQKHLDSGTLSASCPIADSFGRRALVPKHIGNDLPLLRAETRAVGRHLLRADIARFYHTIYTHSVPWALHGKSWAKANRTGGIGNELDRALRNAQDGQTLGIPVGPDTSLVIAEIIATAVDIRLPSGIRGFRYIDDYEFVFPATSAAEQALVNLEESLAEYELALNPLNTVISPLPQALDRDWITDIREYELNERDVDQRSLFRYFNHVFRLAGQWPFESVIAYAVGRLRTASVEQEVWPHYQNLLFQCCTAEPTSLPTVVGQLYRHSKYGVSPRLKDVVNNIVTTHGPLGHASEVAWAIWTAIWFEQDLTKEAAQAIEKIDDPFVWLLALDARDRGRISFDDLSFLKTRLATGELYDRNWLLAYEAPLRGWYGDGKPVASDSNFGPLLAKGVFFYNPKPPMPVAYLVDVSGYGDLTDLTLDRDVNPDF